MTRSPAFLPGMRKRRADNALLVYFNERAATSHNKFSMVVMEVSPGSGTTSSPVPDTEEYNNNSCTVNLPSSARCASVLSSITGSMSPE